MSIQEKIIWFAIFLVATAVVYGSYLLVKNIPQPTIVPPSVEVDKTKIYKDMMTSKCYNEEEVVVPCKG